MAALLCTNRTIILGRAFTRLYGQPRLLDRYLIVMMDVHVYITSVSVGDPRVLANLCFTCLRVS